MSGSWRDCGVATYTTSTAGIGGERLIVAVPTGNVEPVAECLGARSADRDATATMVPPSVWATASAKPVAIAPGPTTPQPITYEPPHVPSTMGPMIALPDNAIIRARRNTA